MFLVLIEKGASKKPYLSQDLNPPSSLCGATVINQLLIHFLQCFIEYFKEDVLTGVTIQSVRSMTCLNPLQEVTIGPINNVAMVAPKKVSVIYKEFIEIRKKNAKLKQTQKIIILHYFIVE